MTGSTLQARYCPQEHHPGLETKRDRVAGPAQSRKSHGACRALAEEDGKHQVAHADRQEDAQRRAFPEPLGDEQGNRADEELDEQLVTSHGQRPQAGQDHDGDIQVGGPAK